MRTQLLRRRKFLLTVGAPSVGLLTGCTGSESTGTRSSPSPVPQLAAIPYTADTSNENVAQVRDLRIWNNTDAEQRVSVTIKDTQNDVIFYRRVHTIQPDSEPRFRDLMAKMSTYQITFDLDVGVQQSYSWPVDDEHGNARAVFGGDATSPTITFRVEPR